MLYLFGGLSYLTLGPSVLFIIENYAIVFLATGDLGSPSDQYGAFIHDISLVLMVKDTDGQFDLMNHRNVWQ